MYFNHSIHVNKGIGCTSCHGRENQMQLVWQDQTLYMSWCLQCHRHPEKYIAPRDQVFNPERVALKDEGRLDEARQLREGLPRPVLRGPDGLQHLPPVSLFFR